jgi:hypothetical protein
MKRILIYLGLAVLLGAMLLPTISFSGNPNPRILPPHTSAFGMT